MTFTRFFLCIASIGLILTVGAAQAIVYDNTTNSLDNNFPLLPTWLNESIEAGDEIWLGGSEREVVELQSIFNHRGVLDGSFDAQLRFRYYDEAYQGPGDVFYDSGIIADLPVATGLNTYTFAIPNVVVPDRFVWTLQIYDRQGFEGEFGPAYYNPATVGFSDDFFWQTAGPDWTAYSWGGDPYANFGARLTAVPEPGTLAVLGLATLFLRRRRN